MQTTLTTTNHIMERHTFFKQFSNFWADLYGEPYALLDIKVMSEKEIIRIREITERIGAIYFKTAKLLRILDDETLVSLGLPRESISFVRLQTMSFESVIARIDLVAYENEQGEKTYKHVEINADTPTFIVELNRINGHVARYFGYDNPNQDCEKELGLAVRNAIFESHDQLGHEYYPHVVFTAHEENEEDWNTTKYLADISGVDYEVVPLQKLNIVENEGVFDENYKRIDVLYRQTYPIEHLVEDEADDGTKIGLQLMKLVKQGKVSIVNPPSAFLLQSKAIQALIWGLHEENSSFFEENEHKWIHNYFLPTYLEKDVFIERNEKYVKKPSFGREGDTVSIYHPNGQKLMEDSQQNYQDSLPVYQSYIELPKIEVLTPKGQVIAHELIGSFLINGEAGAIGIRAGNQITGNESAFLPVGMYKDKK